MPDRSRKRPRDTNQLARSIVDAATSEGAPEEDTRDEISKAAAALGRRGGLKEVQRARRRSAPSGAVRS